MANEFVARNGLIAQNNSTITGSLNVTAGITGSLLGTSSFASTASYITSSAITGTVTSASYALTASYAINGGGGGGTTDTGSLLTTASVLSNTITFTKGDTSTFSLTVATGSGGGSGTGFPFSGSAIITGSLLVSGSTISTLGFTGSLQGTSSWANNATTASSADAFTVRGNLVVSGSTTIGDATTDSITFNAATMSLGNGSGILNIDSNTLYVDGANNRVGIGTTSPAYTLDVNGTGNFSDNLLIQKSTFPNIIIQNTSTTSGYPFITLKNSAFSSIADGDPIGQISAVNNSNNIVGQISFYKSGSSTNTIFNTSIFNTPVGYVGIGTLSPLYRLDVSGSIRLSSGGTMLITGLTNVTQSNVVSINTSTGQLYYQNTISTSSYAITASYALVSSGTVTNAISASYALTASYAMNGGGAAFPYTGSAGISGSLLVDGNVGIGTITPTTRLHVYDGGNAKIAHFEGANGFPIQIITTSGSLTVGYTASLGSIGNGDGILYLKTGSSDPDWAPISYDNHLVQQTYTGIDLSGGDYTILGPGIYEITNAQTNDLIFPDPASFNGQRIVVINTDGSNAANIDNTNTYAPYTTGNGTQLASIGTEDMYDFISIGSKWRGIRSGK